MVSRTENGTQFSLLDAKTEQQFLAFGVNCDERGTGESSPTLRCAQGTVRAGEAIFYPAHTWHETLNGAGISVALTATAIQPTNTGYVEDKQRAACRREIDFDSPTDEVCERLGACYQWWQDGLGGDFAAHSDPHCQQENKQS